MLKSYLLGVAGLTAAAAGVLGICAAMFLDSILLGIVSIAAMLVGGYWHYVAEHTVRPRDR